MSEHFSREEATRIVDAAANRVKLRMELLIRDVAEETGVPDHAVRALVMGVAVDASLSCVPPGEVMEFVEDWKPSVLNLIDGMAAERAKEGAYG